jgi:hypothetical protein
LLLLLLLKAFTLHIKVNFFLIKKKKKKKKRGGVQEKALKKNTILPILFISRCPGEREI